MAKVKGTMLVDFVKTVRADKSGACMSQINDQDKELISNQIISSAWYPYGTYRRCFMAAFKMIAKEKTEPVREWGRQYGE